MPTDHHSPRKPDYERQPKRLSELEELISDALKAAHVARDKGAYTVSREATRCVHDLRRIKTLSLSPRLIFATDSFRPMKFLATNVNPKIRSEARSVLDHWRHVISVNQSDRPLKKKPSSAVKPKRKASARRADDSPEKEAKKKNRVIQIEKTEFQELSKAVENSGESAKHCSTLEAHGQEYQGVYETVKKAHEAVIDRNFLTPESSRRCVVTLKEIFQVPRAVTRDLLLATDAGNMMDSLSEHSDASVQSMAESLLDYWRTIIHGSV